MPQPVCPLADDTAEKCCTVHEWQQSRSCTATID